MSLIVYTFYIDCDSSECIEEDLSLIDSGKELAGCESWRNTVYNSPIVKSIGGKFLPTLSNSNLWIENREIEDFEAEVKMLLDNADKIARALNYNCEAIKFRLNNILEAIERAKKQNGGVIIA